MNNEYRHPKHDEIEVRVRTGGTNLAIAAELKVDRRAVARVREILGMPPLSNGTTREDKLDRFSSEPDVNGHVTWTGRRGNSGTPVIRHLGRERSAASVAFERRTGRTPVGQCASDCGVHQCIADGHVVDDLERRTVRMQERALYGLPQQPWDSCPEGHSWEAEGRVEPDLTPYCRACGTDRYRRTRTAHNATRNEA